MGMQPNIEAGLSYVLGWVTGLIFFLMEKQNRFVRFHAMQSILFFGGLTVIRIILSFIGAFGIPGLGSYTIDAIQAQDFAVVRSMVFIGSVLYIAGLLLTDLSYTLRPAKGTSVYCMEKPSVGGDTIFANMYLAYEALPADMKKRIKGLKAIHDATYNSAGIKRKGYDDVTDPRRAPGAHHGLVRRHPETGRKCLFLGRRRNSYIVGLPLEESEALLDALWAHATQPRFAFCQQWQVGDLMIWDNRCTLHRRDPFDPNARRVMHRTQIKGDRP